MFLIKYKYVHMNIGTHRDSGLELELQVVVNNLMWLVGIELRSSRETVHAVNH